MSYFPDTLRKRSVSHLKLDGLTTVGLKHPENLASQAAGLTRKPLEPLASDGPEVVTLWGPLFIWWISSGCTQEFQLTGKRASGTMATSYERSQINALPRLMFPAAAGLGLC